MGPQGAHALAQLLMAPPPPGPVTGSGLSSSYLAVSAASSAATHAPLEPAESSEHLDSWAQLASRDRTEGEGTANGATMNTADAVHATDPMEIDSGGELGVMDGGAAARGLAQRSAPSFTAGHSSQACHSSQASSSAISDDPILPDTTCAPEPAAATNPSAIATAASLSERVPEGNLRGQMASERPSETHMDGTRLRLLDLSHNPLGDAGLAALAQGLQHSQTLSQLGLRYVNRDPPDADGQQLEPFPLAPLLSGRHLHSLDLSYNFIAASSSSSVDDLREILASNGTIHTLSLRRCCIGGWRRARAIARGLARNHAITSMDLGYNGLGAAAQADASGHQPKLSLAIDALCEALEENKTLRTLGLAHNCLGDRGTLAVLRPALASPSLTCLDLRANNVRVATLRVITAMLRTANVRWLPAAAGALSSSPSAGAPPDGAGPYGLPHTPPLADGILCCPLSYLPNAYATREAGGGEERPRCSLQHVDLRDNAVMEMLCGSELDGAQLTNQSPALARYQTYPGTARPLSVHHPATQPPPPAVPPAAEAGQLHSSQLYSSLRHFPPWAIDGLLLDPLLATVDDSESDDDQGSGEGCWRGAGAQGTGHRDAGESCWRGGAGSSADAGWTEADWRSRGEMMRSGDPSAPSHCTSDGKPVDLGGGRSGGGGGGGRSGGGGGGGAGAQGTGYRGAGEARRALWPLDGGGGRRLHARKLCPFYMCRQLEVNASMRTILVKWLVELYDELELPADALLHGIFHVDRFLSLQVGLSSTRHDSTRRSAARDAAQRGAAQRDAAARGDAAQRDATRRDST